LSIDRREKSIHKMNKPPCYIEGDSDWKENDTAKELAVRYHQLNNKETKDLGNSKRTKRAMIQTKG